MNTKISKIQIGSSLTSYILVIVIVAIGAYTYLDFKADTQAKEAMVTLVENAKTQGVDISYDAIDSSPLAQSITLQNFKIDGNNQEPDIVFGNLIISGLDWQSLQGEGGQNHVPLAMEVNITDGKILLNKEMIGNDADLQSFVNVMGNELSFAISAAYKVDKSTGQLMASFNQSVDDNFMINSQLELGNTAWLAYVDTNESLDDLVPDLLATTLKGLSITFNNQGIIEKIRAISSKQSGLSNEQLTQQTVQQLRQIQTALKDYSPVYSLMIEELIKFSQQPNQLLISIDPEQPLTSDDFLKVVMGGQSAPFDLMKKAQLFIRAN